jgi:hypothetical protein
MLTQTDMNTALALHVQVPPHCVPIHANVTTYDWRPLIAATQFDVIMMDPPWQLATANPTRGVALGYSQVGGGPRSPPLLRKPLPLLSLRQPSLFQGSLQLCWGVAACFGCAPCALR